MSVVLHARSNRSYSYTNIGIFLVKSYIVRVGDRVSSKHDDEAFTPALHEQQQQYFQRDLQNNTSFTIWHITEF